MSIPVGEIEFTTHVSEFLVEDDGATFKLVAVGLLEPDLPRTPEARKMYQKTVSFRIDPKTAIDL